MVRARSLVLVMLLGCGAPATSPQPVAAVAPPPPSPAPVERPAPVTHPPIAMTPKQLLEKLFTEPHADPSWFQPAFLAHVPPAKLDEVTQQVLAASGKLRAVRETPDPRKFEITFEKGTWDATIALSEGKVETLFVRPGAASATTLEAATAPLRELPGKVAFTILSSGKTLAQEKEGDALAVGSAFKLAVLVELRDRIEKQKKLAWDRVVPLDPKWRSLPSGMLQDWPTKTPVTVQTLASLMISISDNTATDAVIHLLGRGSLDSYGGAKQLRPFLTTSHMFRLKAKGQEALLERFRKASSAERTTMLAELEKLPLPRAEDYPTGVTALDVEWFFTPVELCAFMAKVHDLPLMSINPGVAKKADWDSISYKGGSEPGAISMTTWVTKGTKSYCVSATWNDDKPVSDTRFAMAYSGVLAFLAKAP
jgi:beta-lactamase class A